jgi:hypothetical protein
VLACLLGDSGYSFHKDGAFQVTFISSDVGIYWSGVRFAVLSLLCLGLQI